MKHEPGNAQLREGLHNMEARLAGEMGGMVWVTEGCFGVTEVESGGSQGGFEAVERGRRGSWCGVSGPRVKLEGF